MRAAGDLLHPLRHVVLPGVKYVRRPNGERDLPAVCVRLGGNDLEAIRHLRGHNRGGADPAGPEDHHGCSGLRAEHVQDVAGPVHESAPQDEEVERQAEEIASVVLWLCSSGASYAVGHAWSSTVGKRWAPVRGARPQRDLQYPKGRQFAR